MVETVIAVLVVTAVFFGLFRLSRLLSGKILLEHAAMRVARARAVGFNDFMCAKAAHVAVIPVAGRRLWPDGEDALSASEELARVRTYLESPDGARARGLLEYEGWNRMGVNPGDGGWSVVSMPVEGLRLEGRAGIEDGASYYMSGGM
ncbi:MAG: hypothetical protein J6T51_05715 [Kiritimatiellae bacterium]|nr:hypothetical protein [Kiritimatiellia bacterium]